MSKRKMTAKQEVLQRWPTARCITLGFYQGKPYWLVDCISDASCFGDGSTPRQAWASAVASIKKESK